MNRLLTIALAICAAVPARALADNTPPLLEPLAALIERTHRATAHPFGTAIAVVKDGEVIYEGYFGYRDIAQHAPVTRDTVFYIASVTKPFLALNVLLKEHDGRLDTGMSLQEMFPDARFEGFNAGAVTMRDLLIHTSGIDNAPLVWATAFSGIHDAQSRHRLVTASYANDEAPHGVFDYSNVGYNIASVWLDEHFAMPWQAQLDAAIFQPLDMRHTSTRMSEAAERGWRLAKPYSFASADPNRPLYLVKADNTMQAAGGMIATAPDLAQFLIAQLSLGVAGDTPALPEAVIARSHQPQAVLEDSFLDFARNGYAWGWYTGQYKQRTMLHHFGGFAGFHAHLSFMPVEGIGLVVLNNDDFLGAQLTNLVADYVYGVLLGQSDIESGTAKRFDDLLVQAREFRDSVQQHRQAIRARPWNLSLPRATYAGTYSHALLGDMIVAVTDGEMTIRWGRLRATATAYEQADHVRVAFAPNSGKALAFRVEDGKVEAILFEGVEFSKAR